jgi:hypothetical protein
MNEMKCKRCGANENRIHGFCSMECETAWYYEDDIRDLTARITELEEKQRWIPVGERLPDGGHRAFYEVACIYQDFGELALFSKGRWVIYEGENVYDVTKRVKFWRKRQYLPDEVIAILSKGETNPEVQE